MVSLEVEPFSPEIEKEIARTRIELRKTLYILYDILNALVRMMPSIEEAHPELRKIKHTGELLLLLVGNDLDPPRRKSIGFTVQQYALQLLDNLLGVEPCIQCENGISRTHLAFAIRLAAMQLQQKHPIDPLVELACQWDRMYPLICNIRKAPQAIQHPLFSIMQNFFMAYSANLEVLCIPLTHEAAFRSPITASATGGWNEELLSILPPYLYRENSEDSVIHFAPDSCVPEGLTLRGEQLLNELFPL